MTNKDLLMVIHDYHPAFYKLIAKNLCIKTFDIDPTCKCVGTKCRMCWEETMAREIRDANERGNKNV